MGWVSNTRSWGARPATENPYLGTTVGGTTPGLSYTRSTARAAVHATGRPSFCRVVEQHSLTVSCGMGWVSNTRSRGAVVWVGGAILAHGGARPATENPNLGTTVGGTPPGLSYTRSTARAAVHATGRPSLCRVGEQHSLTGSCGLVGGPILAHGEPRLGWVSNTRSRGAVVWVGCYLGWVSNTRSRGAVVWAG